jgi:leader peptidase (prepilin peptidase) / N-methyltransferase
MEIFTNMFDAERWAAVPFHFWSVVFFAFGSICGSFFNVCIYRMPLNQSVVSPPSHCPHCKYSIPFYLNIPLFTWLWLRGKCANCKAPISPRYFLVELLTGILFLVCWLLYGHSSVGVALAMCTLVSGLLVATFIDLEHFIIPDEITFGGMGVGMVFSFLLPAMHGAKDSVDSMKAGFWGLAIGGGVVYAVLRGGKLLFGKQKIALEPDSKIVFGETGLSLPDQEILFEDLFYRNSDVIRFHAKTLTLLAKTYTDVEVSLSPILLKVGDEEFKPEEVGAMEAVTDAIILPREAMGFGDVKFVAAIGAFTGWQGAMFSLFASSVLGAFVGVSLIVCKRHEWSSKIPYGPYIAAAALVWVFGGRELAAPMFQSMQEVFSTAGPMGLR